MKFKNRQVPLFAQLLLGVVSGFQLHAQSPQAAMGQLGGDFQLSYGFQYQATPRHTGVYSDALTLPGFASYAFSPLWTLRVDATSLKSVEYPSTTRATGVGDMDADISFVARKEVGAAPGVTLDYQLNIPSGDVSQRLGTGEFGHKFTAALTKNPLWQGSPTSWTFQTKVGDLTTKKKANYEYSNAIFAAASTTYTFRKTEKLTDMKPLAPSGTPTIKFEADFIPSYLSTAQAPSAVNTRAATEIYTVSTVTLPLKPETKLSISIRVGLTPYTPRFVAGFQLVQMFRGLKRS